MSIALPVYNGERFVADAFRVDTVQDLTHFRARHQRQRVDRRHERHLFENSSTATRGFRDTCGTLRTSEQQPTLRQSSS